MNYWFIYDTLSGVIQHATLTEAGEWTNLPAGCSVLGPMDASTADAFLHPNYYTVQTGVLTAVSNIAALQLQDAQQAKVAELNAAFNNAFSTGFPSSATGTQVQFGCAAADQQNMSDELNSVNAGISVYPIPWAAFDGSPVSFTTAAQFKQLCQDFYTYKWSQIGNLRTKLGSVQAATTGEEVGVITWK